MKANRLAFLAILMTLSSISALKAQSDSTLSFSLTEAQAYAIDNFYMTRNAELDIESAQKFMREVTAIGLPQVSAGADYSYIPEIPTGSFPATFLENDLPETDDLVSANDIHQNLRIGYAEGPEIRFGVEHNITYNVMLTQLIFSGEYIVGLQASKTYMQMSKERYEKTTIELKQLVANTYYTILILEENEKLLEVNTKNLQGIYEETKKTVDIGLMESIESDQILINVKRTENQLNYVQRQLELMNKMLRYQMGLEVSSEILLTESIDELIDKNVIEEANMYIFNLDEHIDYKLLSTQEKLNLLNLKREKSMYYPTLAGFYRYEDKLEKADFDFTMRHMLGVSLSVPIWESGAKSNRVGQARIELEKSQIMKDQEAERLIMEAEQAKYDYITALERFYNEQQNFELSEKVYKNNTEKYKQGMVSSMDLTLTNNQYIEAQIAVSETALQLLNAKVVLDKAFSKL